MPYLTILSNHVRLLKKAHLRVSQHRLGGALPAGGVSQDRCNSSLGERALGCGRWSGALTEPFRLYVRSLTRAPLGCTVKRGGSLSKAKAPVVQAQRAHRIIALAARGEPLSDALLLSGSESGPERPFFPISEKKAPFFSHLQNLFKPVFEHCFKSSRLGM